MTVLRTIYIQPDLDDKIKALATKHEIPYGNIVATLLSAGMEVATFEKAEAEHKQRMADFVKKLIGPPHVEMNNAHVPQFWHGVLQGLEPIESGASLHVMDSRYKIGGKEYRAYWMISDKSDVPFSIEIYEGSE